MLYIYYKIIVYKKQYLNDNEELMEKLKYIANENSRSVNREIEFAIKKLVKEYEEENNIDISKVLEKDKDKLGV